MTSDRPSGGRGSATLALFAQFLLGLVLGGWAARPAVDARHDDLMVYGAVATVFALALALAAANGLRLVAGLVAMVADLAGLLRKFTRPQPGMSERDRRQDRFARLAATGVHGLVLAGALLIIAVALAAFSDAGFGGLALRFLGVAALLSLFTWKALDAV